jgi:AcrR family transcriptional regulator
VALAPMTMDDVRPMAQSQKSVKKREAILHAAIKIINTKGFVAATMTEIAAAIDLRDAALYYYFPNKQALAFAGHQRSLERFEAILVKVEAGGGMGLCKLRRFLEALLDDAVTNGPQLYFGDQLLSRGKSAPGHRGLDRASVQAAGAIPGRRHGRRHDRDLRAAAWWSQLLVGLRPSLRVSLAAIRAWAVFSQSATSSASKAERSSKRTHLARAR